MIKFSNKNNRKTSQSGQLLLEILLVIAAAAIVVSLSSQLTFISLKSAKTAGDRSTAVELNNETFEAIRSSATEKWQNVFDLTKGSANYYPSSTTTPGKWTLVSGIDAVSINGIDYSRSFTIQNVCRDSAAGARAITGITDSNGAATTCAASGGNYDPSAQRIGVFVSWPNAETVSASEYITRWRNKICLQTSWDSVGGGPASCPATTYGSVTNIVTGATLQLSQ